MFKDRRQSQRYAVSGYVQIQDSVGAKPRECRLTDISDGGARLYVEGRELPDEFFLWVPGGRQRRQCRVVWRLGHEVGAEFTDVPQEQFARRVAGAR
jgi:hypothetical protein